ncbi:condensin complex non-SMC subunit Cnd1 [Pestalotiopsis sp. IQ-011]
MEYRCLHEEQVWSFGPMAKVRSGAKAVPSSASSGTGRVSEMEGDYQHFLGCGHIYSASRRRHWRTPTSASQTGVPSRGGLCDVCWSRLVFEGRGSQRVQRQARPLRRKRSQEVEEVEEEEEEPENEEETLETKMAREAAEAKKALARAVRKRDRADRKQWKVRGHMVRRWDVSDLDSRGMLTEFERIRGDEIYDLRAAERRRQRAMRMKGARPGWRGVWIEHSSVEPEWQGIIAERALALARK